MSVRLPKEFAVEEVSGGCRLDRKFALQSNTPQLMSLHRGLFLERFHVSKVTYLYVKFVMQRNTYLLAFLRAFLETIYVKKFSK